MVGPKIRNAMYDLPMTGELYTSYYRHSNSFVMGVEAA